MTAKYSSLELSAPKAAAETYKTVVFQLVHMLLSNFTYIKSFVKFQRIDYDLWTKFIESNVLTNPDSGLVIALKSDGMMMATTTDGTVTGSLNFVQQSLPQGRRKATAATAVNIVSLLRRMFERRGAEIYHAPRADRLRGPLGIDPIFSKLPIHDIDEVMRLLLQENQRTLIIAVFEGEVHLYHEDDPLGGHILKFATYNPALATSLPVL